MNRFSSEYRYILEHAFADDFWIALLSSSLSLFFLFIAVVSLLSIIGLILMLTFDKSEGRGRYKLAQGTTLLIVMVLFPLLLFSSFISFASMPQMSYVTFNAEHASKIYGFYYKDKIEEYKEYPRYTASRLEDGVVHHKKSWSVNGQYKQLENAIYKKFPDAQYNVIYHPHVYHILNKKFLMCFESGKKMSKSMTIEEMVYDIGLEEERCLNQAATELIKEIIEKKE